MLKMCAALSFFVVLVATGTLAQEPVPGWQPPPPTPQAISPQRAAYKQDAVEFTLAPGEGMEYKYRLEKGAAFLYSFNASGPLHWEMHSVPDGSPAGYAEFFDTQDDRNSANGVYNAAFSGIHGWWWENQGKTEVTIKLTTAGFYTESQEFRRGKPPLIKKMN